MTNPELLTYPFAFDGDRNSIPEKQEAAWNGLFSEKLGFPEETSIPTISGGKNVQRQDMNGAFYFLSNILFYLQKGKIFVWDAGQVYYTPALVSYTDDEDVTTFYVCIKDTESIGPITPNGDEVPATEGWYERKKVTEYVTSKDTVVDTTKIYYRFVTSEYIPVTPWTGANPATIGWYELKDSTYVLSTDTKVDAAKTYYRYAQNEYIAVTPTGTESPKSKGWYELNTYFKYVVTADQLVLSSKVYYKTLGTAPNTDTTHWMSIYDYLYIPPEANFTNLLADRNWVQEHVQDKTAHFRGHFKNWAAVPTDPTKYLADYMGETTPTVNDYIVVEDCSDFPSSLLTDAIKTVLANTEHIAPNAYTNLNGRWYFTLKDVWSSTTTKQGWTPRYQVDEKLSDTLKAAINSGINATLTAQITTNKNNIGTHSITQTFYHINSSSSDRVNLDTLDADIGQKISRNYINKDQTVFANLGLLDTKIGALSKAGNYIVVDNTVLANVNRLDSKMGALTKDGNYVKVTNTILANVNVIDTKIGALTKAGNYITVDNAVLTNVNALDTKMGALTEDGNYIVVDNTVLANVNLIDTKLGAITKAGNYTKVDNTLLANITALDTAISKLSADGYYVKAANTVCANLSALDTRAKANADNIAANASAISAETTRAKGVEATNAANIATNAANISSLDNLKAPKASPELTGTPTAPTATKNTSTTQIATTEFVVTEIEDKIATADALLYKGTIDGGSTGEYGALTPAAHRGWLYKVSTAGKIDGVAVEVGDVLICNTDSTSKATASNYKTIAKNWDFIQANIDGAVIGPENAIDTHIATFNGVSGKLIRDSGYTIKTSVPENALFTDHITTATESGSGNGVKSVTADADGNLTVTKTTFVTPTSYATTTVAGAVKIDDTTLKITEDGVLSCYSDSTFYNNGTSGNIDPSNGRTQLTSATTIVMGEPLQNMSTTIMLWCSSGAVTFDTITGANVIFPQGAVLPTATSGVVIYQLMGIGAGFWCATCLGVFDADVEHWNYDPTTKALTFVEAGDSFSYDESEKTLATASSRFSYDDDTKSIVYT